MYNWRVENFNSLLYLDTQHHQYAFTFDCNSNLEYDDKMFSRKYHSVNNYGLTTIMAGIKECLPYWTYTAEPNNEDFFRD